MQSVEACGDLIKTTSASSSRSRVQNERVHSSSWRGVETLMRQGEVQVNIHTKVLQGMYEGLYST